MKSSEQRYTVNSIVKNVNYSTNWMGYWKYKDIPLDIDVSKWLEMKCWLIFQMRKTIRYFSNRLLSYIQSFFIELKHMNKEKQRIWQLKKYFKGFSDSFLLSFCTFVKSFLPKSIQWHKYRNYPQRGMQIKYSLILSVVW